MIELINPPLNVTVFQSRSSIYLLTSSQKKKKKISQKTHIRNRMCRSDSTEKEGEKGELGIKFGSIVVTLTDMDHDA